MSRKLTEGTKKLAKKRHHSSEAVVKRLETERVSGMVTKRPVHKKRQLNQATARLLKTENEIGKISKGRVNTRLHLSKQHEKQVKTERKSTQEVKKQPKKESKSTKVVKKQPQTESKSTKVAKKQPEKETKSTKVVKKQSQTESKSTKVVKKQSKKESKSTKVVKRRPQTESKSAKVAKKQPEKETKSTKVVEKQPKKESKSTKVVKRRPKTESKPSNVAKSHLKTEDRVRKVAKKHTKTESKSRKIEKRQMKTDSKSSKGDSQQVERPPIAKHDINMLDLAFAMDCTGSMGSYIDSARNGIRKIVEEIVASEKSDVRLALVEYRDHPPQDSTFVTRVHDFTPSPATMRKWLSDSSARGGGDLPEAVADALHDVLKLSWRDEATKICVCVSDAPPHGLNSFGDGFPNGCPVGIDPMVVANQLAEKGITLYVAGCEPSLRPYRDFFMAIAYITGGQYVPLTKAQVLTRIIVGGAQEEMSIEQFMAEVDEEVEANIDAGIEIDEEEITRVVHGKMKSKGIRTKQLRMNKAKLASVADSPMAKKFSRMKGMAEIRKTFKFSGKASPAKLCSSSSSSRVKKKGCTRKAAKRCSRVSKGTVASGKVVTDSYDTVEDTISFAQVCRMVKKSVGGKARRLVSLVKK